MIIESHFGNESRLSFGAINLCSMSFTVMNVCLMSFPDAWNILRLFAHSCLVFISMMIWIQWGFFRGFNVLYWFFLIKYFYGFDELRLDSRSKIPPKELFCEPKTQEISTLWSPEKQVAQISGFSLQIGSKQTKFNACYACFFPFVQMWNLFISMFGFLTEDGINK